MNILLINHYAGAPAYGMEYRPFYFGREWVRAGHRVMIVGAGFSHLRRQNPYVDGSLGFESIEGVDYLWVKTPPYAGNGVGRVRNMLAFLSGLRGRCGRHIRAFAPDAIIASSTYTWDNWVAARYARETGAKYIYEVHDLWPLSPMELGGMPSRHPFIWTLQRAENFACTHADSVVSLLPLAGEHLQAHGMSPDKFVHIPNGIDLTEWETCEPVPETHSSALTRAKHRYELLVGYVGGHALSNALDSLVEAAADERLKDIGIVCVGDGAEKPRLQRKAGELASSIVFLPPVPKRSIPALLPRFDILYSAGGRSPLYRFGVSPNKIFEYMMSGVPIVHAIEAAEDPVVSAGCGISIPPQDPDALVGAIRTLADSPEAERRALGRLGLNYAVAHHDVRLLAKRFIDAALAGVPNGGTV